MSTWPSRDPALSEPVSGGGTVSVDAGQRPLLTVHDDAQTRVVRDPYVLLPSVWVVQATSLLTISTGFAGIARPFRAKLRRSFATVQDTPVRRYGGLKDQDRIFTNAYCRHDHGIKGATVRPRSNLAPLE